MDFIVNSQSYMIEFLLYQINFLAIVSRTVDRLTLMDSLLESVEKLIKMGILLKVTSMNKKGYKAELFSRC